MDVFQTKCRACLEFEGDKPLSDFHKECLIQFGEMLTYCTSITINTDEENLPTKLCKICATTLSSFYKFKLTVMKCEEKLREFEKNLTTNIKSKDYKENESKFSMCIDNNLKESNIENVATNWSCNTPTFEKIRSEPKKSKPHESSLRKTTIKCSAFKTVRAVNKSKKSRKTKKIGAVAIFTCDICHKTFTRNDHLSTHKRIHTGERPFKCTMCPKSFIQQGCLKLHIRTHTGEKPHMCDICGKSFSQSASLAYHVKIHSEPNTFAYKCEICKKRFAHSGNLNIHMRYHNNIRNFSCNICKKSFVTSSNLSEHMKQHTNERNEKCPVCKKAFYKKQHLKNHMVIHNGERPFECSMCFRSYTQAAHLNRHKKCHAMKMLNIS